MTSTIAAKPTRFLRTTGTAVALTMAVILAGCGSDESTETAAVESPIAEFLGQDDFLTDPDAAEAQFIEQERERQEIIAECMKEQGFEYVPVDMSDVIDFGGDGEEEWGSDEWVAKWGFGITTQRYSQAQVGDNLLGFDDSFMTDDFDNDPNNAIVEALSPAEQEAYYEALYGGDDSFPAFDESLSDEEIEAQMEDFTFEPQGCEGEGYEADQTTRFYMDFSDDLQAMEERMQADPRVTAKQQEIADCVAEKGQSYTKMEDVYEYFDEKLQAIDSQLSYPGEDLGEEDFAQMSEAEIEEMFNNPPELSDEAKATLAELQTEEIELATVVNECGGGFQNEFELYSEIRVEYEREFLEEHADELEVYKQG